MNRFLSLYVKYCDDVVELGEEISKKYSLMSDKKAFLKAEIDIVSDNWLNNSNNDKIKSFFKEFPDFLTDFDSIKIDLSNQLVSQIKEEFKRYLRANNSQYVPSNIKQALNSIFVLELEINNLLNKSNLLHELAQKLQDFSNLSANNFSQTELDEFYELFLNKDIDKILEIEFCETY